MTLPRPRRRLWSFILSLTVLAAIAPPARADFAADAEAATTKIETVLPECEKKMNAGDFAGANAALLSAFPEATRTAADSFVLGNVLFEMDRKQSYALHQAAAKADPENPNIAWEWAMEQHRAGEWAGALAAYQQFSKSRPKSAAPYALQADCLLHLGRIDEAMVAWKNSEDAPNGQIEQMENLVCAVKRDPRPHQRRADLLAKVKKNHDANAAMDLIALDCDFPRDWWNAGVNQAYLTNDMGNVLAALQLPDDDLRIRSMRAASVCAILAPDDDNDEKVIRDTFKTQKLLIDAQYTLPPNGALLAVLVHAGVASKVIDESTLHDKIGPKVLAAAKQAKDLDMWNVAAYASSAKDAAAAMQLERDGWQATADPRFAAAVLYMKLDAKQLTADDADLLAALKQFPESGLIQRAAFEVALKDKKLTRQQLAAAAMAEFHHFTSFTAPATVVNRPRSDYLRGYFALLLHDYPTTQPAAGK